MNRWLLHLIFPFIILILFFANAFTPVEVLGCFTRGLVALIITLISGILALVSIIIGIKGKSANDKNFYWWLITTIILTVPVIALIILA